MNSNTADVFYDGAITVVDLVIPGKDLGVYSGENLEQLRKRYPNMVRVSYREAAQRIESAAITQPEASTMERFDELLNCLPPVNWHRYGDSEVFQLSERYTGRVTTTVARIGERCFIWLDIANMPAPQLIAKAVHAAEQVG